MGVVGIPDSAGPGLVLGSHLDSVPDGGAYDGPLGVVSAFAALDLLRARGFAPRRPLGIVSFADEEGARFGVACAGSRLLTGALAADRALGLRDADGVTLAEALRAAGRDPAEVGPDRRRWPGSAPSSSCTSSRASGWSSWTGRSAVADRIRPHGRWRLDLAGEANHAGTTRLADRRDPMLALAAAITAARDAAAARGRVATVGKVAVQPTG